MSTTTDRLPGLYPPTEAIKVGDSRRYFVVESETGINAVHEASAAHIAAAGQRQVFAQKHGADGMFLAGEFVRGLAVKRGSEPTQGVDGLTWKFADQSNVSSDDCDLWVAIKGRKKAERKAYWDMEREYDKMRPPYVGSMIARRLGMMSPWSSAAPMGKLYIHYPEAFDIGGVFVLAFKKPPEHMKVADGLREIDRVEFLKLAMAHVD